MEKFIVELRTKSGDTVEKTVFANSAQHAIFRADKDKKYAKYVVRIGERVVLERPRI